MKRKLASIQEIIDIQPIPNADAIEVATIKGWKVVVEKDEFNIGDMVVYFEIDSFLPILPEFEFLRKSSYKKMEDGSEGFRLRTIKLRKQISQGLIISIYDAFKIASQINPDYAIRIEEEIDVTEQLCIKKYEPPIPAQLSGTMKGNFPSYIAKSDEERIQNIPGVINAYKNIRFYISEKLDGTSGTFFVYDSEFGVCSRNIQLKEDTTNTYWQIAHLYELENKMKTLLKNNIAIQGEIVGPGIQKNKYKLNNVQLRLFTVFDIDTQQYGSYDDLIKTAELLNIPMVPIIDDKFYFNDWIEDDFDYLIEMADGQSDLYNQQRREGLVFRNCDNMSKISFKIVSNKYLEKEK